MKKESKTTNAAAVRNEQRKQVFRLKAKGLSNKAISEIVGVSASSVYRYLTSGQMEEKTRGRSTEEQQRLEPEMERRIRKMITDKTPDQYKLPFALWNRKSIAELVLRECDVTLAPRTVGDYLARWGFSFQKAKRSAYEQNPEAVRKWLETDYPKIKELAKAENAEIHWADETGVRNDDQSGRGYAPIGETPVLRTNGQRFRTNMISSVSNAGKLHFMIYQESMTYQLFRQFLLKLSEACGKKVFVIVDNLKVHHAKDLAKWLEEGEVKSKIRVFYLPSYSPELNPDEYLNGDFKGELNRREPSRSQKDLEGKVEDCIRTIQSNSERVANYFKHPLIQYAA